MKLKTFLIAGLLALASKVGLATPAYVQVNPSSTQSGSFIVQGGTVTTTLALPFLSSGSFVMTDSHGNLATPNSAITNYIQNTTTHQPNSAVNIDSATLNYTFVTGAGLTAGTSAQVLLSRGSSLSPYWGGSTILQSSQTFVSASSGTTASGFVKTGIKVTVTPYLSTSKVRLHFSGSIRTSSQSADVCILTIERNASNLATNDHLCLINSGTLSATSLEIPCSVTLTDSPASTSAQTYEVYIRTSAGGTTCTVGFSGNSVLIADEIIGI